MFVGVAALVTSVPPDAVVVVVVVVDVFDADVALASLERCCVMSTFSFVSFFSLACLTNNDEGVRRGETPPPTLPALRAVLMVVDDDPPPTPPTTVISALIVDEFPIGGSLKTFCAFDCLSVVDGAASFGCC